MLRYINIALEQTINTLIDITAYSKFGVPVRAVDIARRQHLSLSRMEITLSALKSAYLIRSTKGRRGGYYLAKDPQSMTIKDVFLAVNHFRSRKVIITDFTKEIIESFESYMRDCLSRITVASSAKDANIKPFQIETIPAWDSQKYQLNVIPKNSKWDKQSILITKAELQKTEKQGPNSIFDFSNYL